jgi:hypothetical protein
MIFSHCTAWVAGQLPFGGRDITSYIERYLVENGEEELEIKSLADFNVVDRIKRECCYCGTGGPLEHEDSYEMPDGTEVRVDRAGGDEDGGFPCSVPHKFFFDPLKLDWADTSMEFSVHDRLHEAVMQSPIDGRRAMWGNCVIAGGNTCVSYSLIKSMAACMCLPGSLIRQACTSFPHRGGCCCPVCTKASQRLSTKNLSPYQAVVV